MRLDKKILVGLDRAWIPALSEAGKQCRDLCLGQGEIFAEFRRSNTPLGARYCCRGCLQLGLAQSANMASTSPLEQHQRWDAANTVLGRSRWLASMSSANLQAVAVVTGNLVRIGAIARKARTTLPSSQPVPACLLKARRRKLVTLVCTI